MAGIFFGVETLDDSILNNVFNKKGQNNDKVRSLLKTSMDLGIFTTTSWIYPMPNYTDKIYSEVRDFITEMYANRSSELGSVVVLPSIPVPNSDWFFDNENFGFEIPDKQSLIQDYIHLVLKLYVPRSLLGKYEYYMQGSDFHQITSETDKMIRELGKKNIPMSITDDWMLMGKLSSLNMEDFRKESVDAMISGKLPQTKVNSYKY